MYVLTEFTKREQEVKDYLVYNIFQNRVLKPIQPRIDLKNKIFQLTVHFVKFRKHIIEKRK